MSQEIENNFEERKKDWDLTGLLDDVIRRYIYQLTNDELNEINLEKASGMPDEEIKNGIKLPLATMQQRRETWGSQSKLDVQEPMIFILQSTVEKLSVGDKIPLSDADSFLIHQESGVLNYELHYLMNGTPQEYNAFLDLSKVKVADTLMDGVTHSTPPALSDYLERHQQLNDTELGAKRLQKLNCDSKNVSYANALLSYVREARECLNSGKQLPQRPTRSSITLEKPNEEVAVPLSEQTPEETAVLDLNSAPEISIPSSNNEEVMQHQNTTPESPEAEHQQAKMENLMDISLPLVDQEPFQEILQALLKNDMSQAANLLQYLGSHLDKLQEEHQKMQVEFRELKEQVNSIDERFFNDSDSVDTVQNNLDQSEKLITLNKSRLANVVLQTKSKLKTAGKNALLSFAEKIHVPKALASLQKGMQHTQDSLDGYWSKDENQETEDGETVYRYFLWDGTMITDQWAKIEEEWYFFDANGVMQRGWLWKSGGWYYLDEETGAMQKGWIKIEKDEYFLSESSGRMKTGWTHWKKKWYYLESNGKLAKNTERYLMGHTFHFNKTGEWVKD